MDRALQELFGVNKVDDPALPGTRARDPGKVIYAFLRSGSDMAIAFEELTAKAYPPIPKNGAALLEHWAVKTPEGENFYSIYFHGDVEGWRQQIEFGAVQLGLKTARVTDDKFIVSDGPTFRLSECAITLDGSPFTLPGS